MRRQIRHALRAAALLLAWFALRTAAAATPAFPGAVGQGAAATGGRGGDVYHVTNLADYNPAKNEVKIVGSLRHAIRSADGPRTIVFDVGGAIALAASLEIRKDNMTIAGQSSPGGITAWGYPCEVSGARNVIVRFLRFRVGDFHVRGNRRAEGGGDLDASSANGVSVSGCERVVLDHLSASWGIDETLSVTKSRDVTVQHSIIAESLNGSYHPKGRHGYGSLVRGELTAEDQKTGRGGYTFFGNLWAHHRARNPSVGGQQSLDEGQSESGRRRTDVNLVNNVIYDWGDQATHRSEGGDVRINLVGNSYVAGPAMGSQAVLREGTPGRTALFHRGNMQDLDRDTTHEVGIVEGSEAAEQTFQGFAGDDVLMGDGEPLNFFASIIGYELPAEKAYERVIGAAGASLWRDGVDRRVIESLAGRTGRLIDSQEEFRTEAGKLPGIDDLRSGRRDTGFDADGDGMADDFERRRGLDWHDAADGAALAADGSGYTNLEIYLNELVELGLNDR